MPIYQNPSETSKGKNENFYLQLARGHIANHYPVHKFGAVPAMATNTLGTIWDINNTVYPWASWDTAGIITLTRASTSDANKVITVQGLDTNYNFAEEDITLTATSGNAGSVSWRRVNRMFIKTDIAGNIGDITAVKDGVNVARITATFSQTLMAVYTIPAGKTGFLLQGTMSAQDGKDASGLMMVRYFGTNVFRIGHAFEVSSASNYNYTFAVPIAIPEKSDIDIQARSRDRNGRYAAAFDMILVDN